MSSVLGFRPSAFGRRSSVLGLRPSVLGLRPSAFGLRSSVLGFRPSAFGLMSSVLGFRPSAFGRRSSVLGLRPSVLGPCVFGFPSPSFLPAPYTLFRPHPVQKPSLAGFAKRFEYSLPVGRCVEGAATVGHGGSPPTPPTIDHESSETTT